MKGKIIVSIMVILIILLLATTIPTLAGIPTDTGTNPFDKILAEIDNLWAKINNDVVFNHITKDHDAILFCNNDITIVNNSTIDRMYEVYLKNKKIIGTVGCRLLYPNNTIQHDGQTFVLPIDLHNPDRPKNIDENIIAFTHRLLHKSHNDNPRPSPRIVAGNTFALYGIASA